MKTQLTIKAFCAKHNACKEGREWAVKNCQNMQGVWDTARPDWVIWIATKKGVLNDRDLRLFAVYCARSCQKVDADPRSIAAIDCAEKYAKGEVTAEEELAAARSAAWSAWLAARSAAWSAWSAARSAESAARSAESAAWSAESVAWSAESAAWSAAWSAARSAESAARSTAESAARSAESAESAESAARSAQAKWLRNNTIPNFDA